MHISPVHHSPVYESYLSSAYLALITVTLWYFFSRADSKIETYRFVFEKDFTQRIDNFQIRFKV